jgi:putative ABC transport system permease protein
MIRDIFLMSLSAMRSHKVRTFLTLLGVILGITSVVSISTAGYSFSNFIEEETKLHNPTSMTIGLGAGENIASLSLMEKVLTDKDVEHIQNLPHIKKATPIGAILTTKIGFKYGLLKWDWKQSSATFLSANPSLLDIQGWELAEGRLFEEGKNEVIISKRMVNFFNGNPKIKVGSEIYIQRLDRLIPIKTKIVGIMKNPEKTITSFIFPDIIGPIDPYYITQRGSRDFTNPLHPVTLYSMVSAIAEDVNCVNEAKKECLEYLNSDKSDAMTFKSENLDFIIVSQQDLIIQTNHIMSTVNMFIVAIASISLIVGTIGIANIMFANVNECTKEIGTMRALGAKKRDILLLFLYQSLTIGLLGGVLGCILGASSGYFVVTFINNNLEYLFGKEFIQISLLYSYEWFIIALFVGIVVGIIAGILPALKAARMDPVKALKYE